MLLDPVWRRAECCYPPRDVYLKLRVIIPKDLISFGFRKRCRQRPIVLLRHYGARFLNRTRSEVAFFSQSRHKHHPTLHQIQDLFSFSSPHHMCLRLAENREKANGNSWNRFRCSLQHSEAFWQWHFYTVAARLCWETLSVYEYLYIIII